MLLPRFVESVHDPLAVREQGAGSVAWKNRMFMDRNEIQILHFRICIDQTIIRIIEVKLKKIKKKKVF